MEKEKMSTRQVAFMAVFAAIILLATYVVKIPTPVYGYIHAGDGFVLLAGILLGPLPGALAAGIGSALSDLIGGYPVWVPGTFAVKFLAALVAAALYQRIRKKSDHTVHKIENHGTKHSFAPVKIRKNTDHKARQGMAVSVAVSGVIAELVMTGGYFFYNVLLISLLNTEFSGAGFASAGVLAAGEVPFNLVQGALGVAVAVVLAPLFLRRLRR